MSFANWFATLGAGFLTIFAAPALYMLTDDAVRWLAGKYYSTDTANMITDVIWYCMTWPLSFCLLRATLYTACAMILLALATWAPRFMAGAAFN